MARRANFVLLLFLAAQIANIGGSDCIQSSEGLTEVPTDIDSSCTYIDLSNNQITHIPAGIFSNRPVLNWIVLYGNPVTSVAAGAFAKLPALYSVQISFSPEHFLPAACNCTFAVLILHDVAEFPDLTGFPDLQTLRLENLKAKTISPASIPSDGFTNLTSLYFNNNNFDCLDCGTALALKALMSSANIRSRYYYDASGTRLHEDDRAEAVCQSPSTIDLVTLGDECGCIQNDKGLTEVPKDIDSSCTSIFLINNQITHIPAGIFSNRPNLNGIVLYGNPVTSVATGAFANLPKLKLVQIPFSPEHFLPAACGCTLIGLQLHDVAEFPDLTGFPDLKHLGLDNLKAKTISPASIPSGGFPQLSSLFFIINNFSCLDCGTALALKTLMSSNAAINYYNASGTRLPEDDRAEAVCQSPSTIDLATLGDECGTTTSTTTTSTTTTTTTAPSTTTTETDTTTTETDTTTTAPSTTTTETDTTTTAPSTTTTETDTTTTETDTTTTAPSTTTTETDTTTTETDTTTTETDTTTTFPVTKIATQGTSTVHRSISADKLRGPRAGGSLIVIKLTGYDVTTVRRVEINGTECNMATRNGTEGLLSFFTPRVKKTANVSVVVHFYDGSSFELAQNFTYGDNPVITRIWPLKTIARGGTTINIEGRNFDLLSEMNLNLILPEPKVAKMMLQKSIIEPSRHAPQMNCDIKSDKLSQCRTPNQSNTPPGTELRFGVSMDGVEDYEDSNDKIPGRGFQNEDFVANMGHDPKIIIEISPKFNGGHDTQYLYRPHWPHFDKSISIMGEDMDWNATNWLVEIGSVTWIFVDSKHNMLKVKPPKLEATNGEGEHQIQVTFAQNRSTNTTSVVGVLVMTSLLSEPNFLAAAVVSAVLIVFILCLYFFGSKKFRTKNMANSTLQKYVKYLDNNSKNTSRHHQHGDYIAPESISGYRGSRGLLEDCPTINGRPISGLLDVDFDFSGTQPDPAIHRSSGSSPYGVCRYDISPDTNPVAFNRSKSHLHVALNSSHRRPGAFN